MIKKSIQILVLVLIAGFIVLQFFRIDKTNAAVVPADTLASAVTVPDNVNAILERSCKDCHTNTTVYPWYANVQPVGWFLQSHITDGRRNLNLSTFNTLTAKRKVKKLEEICEQVESKEMPLPSYLWIHRDSVMRDGDAKTLCDWANAEKDKIDE